MPTHTQKAFSPEERDKIKDEIRTLCGLVGIVGVLELVAEIADDHAGIETHGTDYDETFPQKNISQWLQIAAIISRAYDEVMVFLKLN